MNMENFTSVFNSADGPTSIFVAGKTPEIMGVLIAIVVVGVIISLFGLKLVRNNGDDALGRCTFGGINHQQQFHQVVRVRKRRLHQEYVLATNRFFVGYREFAVGEVGNVHVTKGTAQAVADFFCKISRVCARENFKRCCCVHCYTIYCL